MKLTESDEGYSTTLLSKVGRTPKCAGFKKNTLPPLLKRPWRIAPMSAEFFARMERLLWQYRQSYDVCFSLLRFGGCLCPLIGEAIDPLGRQSGKVRREPSAFENTAPALCQQPFLYSRA